MTEFIFKLNPLKLCLKKLTQCYQKKVAEREKREISQKIPSLTALMKMYHYKKNRSLF